MDTKQIGRYQVKRKLGEGGMAAVYLALDPQLKRDVAIKLIRKNAFPPEDYDRILKRFEREARTLSRLDHPNIVQVLDYGEHGGAPYLVLEYVDGETLREKMGSPVPWQEAIERLLPVAGAIAYAHTQGVVHRDIKPGNILIGLDGQIKLTDFGIAMLTEKEETVTLTGTGLGIGTPEYMAPEQWSGQASPQSDQYALGVILYEMVTGRKPFTGNTPAEILLKQATQTPPAPGRLAKGVPNGIEKLLKKVLSREQSGRFASMDLMAMAMRNSLRGPGAFLTSSQLGWGLGSLVLVLLLTGLAGVGQFELSPSLFLPVPTGTSTPTHVPQPTPTRSPSPLPSLTASPVFSPTPALLDLTLTLKGTLRDQFGTNFDSRIYWAPDSQALLVSVINGIQLWQVDPLSRAALGSAEYYSDYHWLQRNPAEVAALSVGIQQPFLITILDAQTFEYRRGFASSSGLNDLTLNEMRWSPQEDLILIYGQRDVVLVSTSSDSIISRLVLNCGLNRAAWAGKISLVALGCENGQVLVLESFSDPLEPRLLGVMDQPVYAVAVSPDGKRVATAGPSGEISIWDVDTGQILGTLSGHKDSVFALAWHPEGRLLASAVGWPREVRRLQSTLVSDFRIRVWDLDRMEVAARLDGPKDWADALAWSPDGNWLAAGIGQSFVELQTNGIYVWRLVQP